MFFLIRSLIVLLRRKLEIYLRESKATLSRLRSLFIGLNIIEVRAAKSAQRQGVWSLLEWVLRALDLAVSFDYVHQPVDGFYLYLNLSALHKETKITWRDGIFQLAELQSEEWCLTVDLLPDFQHAMLDN